MRPNLRNVIFLRYFYYKRDLTNFVYNMPLKLFQFEKFSKTLHFDVIGPNSYL